MVYLTGPVLVTVAEGALIVSFGTVLTTANVLLGPAPAHAPAILLAVPGSTLIPRVPSPVIAEIITVLVFPVPVTVTVPLVLPVLFRVILAAERVMPVAPE